MVGSDLGLWDGGLVVRCKWKEGDFKATRVLLINLNVLHYSRWVVGRWGRWKVYNLFLLASFFLTNTIFFG